MQLTACSPREEARRKKQSQFDLTELDRRRIHSREEFAFYIGVSLRAVDDRLGTLIPYIKVGSRVLIDKDKALAALAAATGRGVE
jgi:hypothetical protein